ncbi:MAG: ABC transporter permease [Chloroflexi bacterium]|nr:ABC transporter permease [Chloroflexota bacterium]
MLLCRVLRSPGARLGLTLLGMMIVLSVLAPLIARYPPDAIDVSIINQGPSGAHWFGTDDIGRDMWSRTLFGGRVSLPAGLGVVAIALGLGAPLGLIAGYAGGMLDDVIMRAMDVLLSFPGVVLAIGVVSILGTGLRSAVIAVGIASLPGYARLARASALSVREQEYVVAARTVGAGHTRILFRHILVNVADPLIVFATLNLGGAILVTAALSFLGIGTQLPTPDWGTMLSEGYTHMFQARSEVTFPGLAIVLTVLGINLLGDGLAGALNPRLD